MAEVIQDISKIAGKIENISRILILGGIGESAQLAALLVERGHWVISSLAGRTREPLPIAGDIRAGGFGGAQGLAEYIAAMNIDIMIDATHPFAKTISLNAIRAAEIAQCRLIVFERASWQKLPDDNWIETNSLAAAVESIPQNAKVLLAIGSQYISVFAQRSDAHFVVRMIDAPEWPILLPSFTMVLAKPGDVVAEKQLLEKHCISHIVCRNSGGVGAYAKIEAARQLHLPVIIINR